MPSMHVDPFWHPFPTQSSMLISQFTPVNPGGQAQVYVPTAFVHVPPFSQGLEAQLSTSVAQVAPV